eukprot:2879979-Lingulodinium_polyedra.AAC.1
MAGVNARVVGEPLTSGGAVDTSKVRSGSDAGVVTHPEFVGVACFVPAAGAPSAVAAGWLC